MKKKCFKCKTDKPLSSYYKHPRMADGHVNKCKECNKKDVRENFSNNKDYYRKYDLHRYRYNIDRLKKHKYTNLMQRCEGRHKLRPYYVEGMSYLSWDEYEKWWVDNIKDFSFCYDTWKNSGFKNKFAPSIDRIDSKKGYTPDNMQWLLFTDNCSKYNK